MMSLHSSDIDTPCVLPYLTEEVTYTTTLYYTKTIKATISFWELNGELGVDDQQLSPHSPVE